MDTISILQNKVSELTKAQRDIIDSLSTDDGLSVAVNGSLIQSDSARILIEAYQCRIDSIQDTIMELRGLGGTVLCNKINEIKSK